MIKIQAILSTINMKLFKLERLISQTGPILGLSSVIESVCYYISNVILLKRFISSRTSNISYIIWEPMSVRTQIYMVSTRVKIMAALQKYNIFIFIQLQQLYYSYSYNLSLNKLSSLSVSVIFLLISPQISIFFYYIDMSCSLSPHCHLIV